MSEKNTLKVISVGFDPGFGKGGYAITYGEKAPGKPWKARVIEFNYFKTGISKAKGKGLIRVSSDDQRRLDEILKVILYVADRATEARENAGAQVVIAGMEWFTPFKSGGRGWTAVLTVGMVYGLFRTRADQFYVHLNTDIKKDFAGKAKASKEEVIQLVQEKFGIDEFEGAKELREHQADAIAVTILNLYEYDKIMNPLGRV